MFCSISYVNFVILVLFSNQEYYSHVARYGLVHRVEWVNRVFSCPSHGSISTVYTKCGPDAV